MKRALGSPLCLLIGPLHGLGGLIAKVLSWIDGRLRGIHTRFLTWIGGFRWQLFLLGITSSLSGKPNQAR